MMVDNDTLPHVAVIVITFNGAHLLERCMSALKTTLYPRFEVVLLDNGSTDDSCSVATAHMPGCKIVRTTKNLGFAGGNNVAIRYCLELGAEFVALLNDDALILDPGWLTRAVSESMDDQSIGMVGFEVVQGNGTYHPDVHYDARFQQGTRRSVERIDGCALFIRCGVFHRIGLFDEIYFMYEEENDLEIRAQRAGFSLVQLSSPVYHIGGVTSRKYPVKIAYYQTRNYLRYAIKNLPWSRAIRRVFTLLDILCNPFPFVYEKSNPDHARMRCSLPLVLNSGIYISALAWNVINLRSTLRLRMQPLAPIKPASDAVSLGG